MVVTQGPKQRRSRIDLKLHGFAVNRQLRFFHWLAPIIPGEISAIGSTRYPAPEAAPEF
jgi:hypothetical protein